MDAFLLFNLFIVICLFLITGIWCYVVYLWVRSIRYSPKLIQEHGQQLSRQPKVSIILPARNEEKNIKKCVESLLNQDYPNFELIVINDGSKDKTLDIIKQIPDKEFKLKIVNIQSKPDEWVGKNWACYKGYLESSGEVLLFTDADTYHVENTLTLSVLYFIKYELDALNLLPRTIGGNLLTKLILPSYTLHQYTFCSPVVTNDPNNKKKYIYFLGQCYLIRRDAYEKIGTHKAVSNQIFEDLAIGKKLRELKFKMNMIRAEFNLYADTIRSSRHILNQVFRVIIPYYRENKLGAIKVTMFHFAINFLPPLLLIYSILSIQFSHGSPALQLISLILSVITISIAVILSLLQFRYGLNQNAWYGLGAPLGAWIYAIAHVIALMKAIGKSSINWKGRIT
jgi:chlorobactene glucosyltransferase